MTGGNESLTEILLIGIMMLILIIANLSIGVVMYLLIKKELINKRND